MRLFSTKKKEILKDSNGQEIKKPVKKFSDFHKSLIIYISVILAITGIFVITSSIYAKKIQAEVKEVTDRRKSQADSHLLTQYVSQLEKDYNTVKEDFGPYLQLLPEKDDLFDFKVDIMNTAKKYKLDPAFSFGVENPATAEEPKSYGFTLIISGSTVNLLSFWDDFAKMKYILRIEQILIDQEDGKTKNKVQELGSGDLSTTTTTTTTIPKTTGSTGSLTLDQELELLAKKKTTTTKTVKKSTTTTKLINTYKMNVLGKIYIR